MIVCDACSGSRVPLSALQSSVVHEDDAVLSVNVDGSDLREGTATVRVCMMCFAKLGKVTDA